MQECAYGEKSVESRLVVFDRRGLLNYYFTVHPNVISTEVVVRSLCIESVLVRFAAAVDLA